MIREIELRRFKKFEHTKITLREFAVLVGENSSGKTWLYSDKEVFTTKLSLTLTDRV